MKILQPDAINTLRKEVSFILEKLWKSETPQKK